VGHYEYLTCLAVHAVSDCARCGLQPDNIWGFPSYAMREAWQRKGPGRYGVRSEEAVGLGAKMAPLYNVLTEPI